MINKSLEIATSLLKILFFGVGLSIWSNYLYSQNKVAVVMSGGGAQGLAHIGVLKAFEEAQIPIDLIVGTSAGALVGGLYASGISIEQLELLAKDGTIMKLFLGRNDLNDIPVWQRDNTSQGKFSIRKSEGTIYGPPGLLNDQLIWRDLFLLTAPGNQRAESDFDSLFVPFRAVGADVVSQKQVIFSSGSLNEALRTSISIPMIYPAIIKDGAILIDGGIYNNMPTDIAQNLGADYIIAINVDDVPPSIENMDDVFDLFDFFSGTFFSFSDSSKVSGWDYFINVDTKGFNLFDFSSGEALIERGYEAGSKASKIISDIIVRKQDTNQLDIRRHKFQTALEDITISHIQWMDQKTGNIIENQYEIETPFVYSSLRIRSLINALYATNTFDMIIPELSGNGNILNLTVRKKATVQMIPEVKISSVDGFNISGDQNYRFSSNLYSIRSKVSIGNYAAGANTTLSSNRFISPYAFHNSRMILKLNVSANYQVLQNMNNSNDVYIYKINMGLSAHRLLSWDKQFITTANIQATRWINVNNNWDSDFSKSIYPVFSVHYENNHIRKNNPVSEGWLVKTGFLSGYWDSQMFYGFEGRVKIGFPVKSKYYIDMDISSHSISEPAPLEMIPVTLLPTAFSRSYYEDKLAYSTNNISLNFSRTVFRNDIFFNIRYLNTYMVNRLINAENGWTSGSDISIKYNSILGPLELGWSLLPDQENQIVSWTKLHIYL